MWCISVSVVQRKELSLTPLPCLHTQREGAPLETINIQLQTQRGASQRVDAIS